MKLKIRDTMLVSDVQSKFNECLPVLKLEFYRNLRTLKNGMPLEGSYKIGDIVRKYEADEIEIMSWHRAIKVITAFKQLYGLIVRVFRLEGSEYRMLENEEVLMPFSSVSPQAHQQPADQSH